MTEQRGSIPPSDISSPTQGEESPEESPQTPTQFGGSEDPALPLDLDDVPLDAVEIVDEGVEVVMDAADAPVTPKSKPKTRPFEANFPPEALKQLQDLRDNVERKDKQIEQVMAAYRDIKGETDKLRDRIKKVERRKFEQSKGDFIARFVEVLDNLDRAIDSIESNFDSDSVLQGIILVRSRLVQLLREEGLEKIFVGGQTYDPTYSEAAGMEDVESREQDGVVLKELQRGYMLKGALLRAARVIVGRFIGSGDAADASAPSPDAAAALPSPNVASPAPQVPPEAGAIAEAKPQSASPPPRQAPAPRPTTPIPPEPLTAPISEAGQTPPPLPAIPPTPTSQKPLTQAPPTPAFEPPPPGLEPPAPVADLLIPPDEAAPAIANEPFSGIPRTTPGAMKRKPEATPENPLLQDDLFEREEEVPEIRGRDVENDDQDFFE